MRPVFVGEGLELTQRMAEVVPVPDQGPVQLFAPASGIGQYRVRSRGEFGASVANEEPDRATHIMQIHGEVRLPAGSSALDAVRRALCPEAELSGQGRSQAQKAASIAFSKGAWSV